MHVEHTASTSALALQELQRGRRLPFAVLAAQQQAGKGQAGRVWHSPRGNLYLSLAVQPHLCQGLSLLVAALVCEWLQTQGVAASCKWPNDILYTGKKLGGVLCEGAMQGEQWRYVIVGIGININVVPQELQAQAISLREIGGQEGNVTCLGEQLARYCVAELDKVRAEDEALARGEPFSAAAAELWCRGEEFFLRQPHPRGYLRLKHLRTRKTEELMSSSPDYRLTYQAPRHYPLLVADVGNSTLKLVLFKDDLVAFTVSALPQERSIAVALRKLRAQLDYEGKWVIYAAAVNQAHLAVLQKQAERHVFEVVAVKTKPFRCRTHCDLQQLGVDRLAAIEAYLADRVVDSDKDDQAAVIANFGTATTIDVMEENHHRGGYILPGLETSMRALADYTALKLPPGKLFHHASPTCGQTTDEAIASGILHSQVEYVRSLAVCAHTKTFAISGGLGKYAAAYLDRAGYDPLLVAKGIRVLLLR